MSTKAPEPALTYNHKPPCRCTIQNRNKPAISGGNNIKKIARWLLYFVAILDSKKFSVADTAQSEKKIRTCTIHHAHAHILAHMPLCERLELFSVSFFS